MGRTRLVVAASIAAVVGVVTIVVVGNGVGSGAYGEAAGMTGDDLAVRSASAELIDRLATAPGVESATFDLTSSWVGPRAVEFTLTAAAESTPQQLGRATGVITEALGAEVWRSATVAVTIIDQDDSGLRILDLDVASPDPVPSAVVWRSASTMLDLPLTMTLLDGNAELSLAGSSLDVLTEVGRHRDELAAIAGSWRLPGICGAGTLPDRIGLDFVKEVALLVPLVDCDDAAAQSGASISHRITNDIDTWTVMLALVDGSQSIDALARYARLAEASPLRLNSYLVAGSGGDLEFLRFYTGDCANPSGPMPGDESPKLIAALAAEGVRVPVAQLGQCDDEVPGI